MQIHSNDFHDGAAIAEEFAFGAVDATTHVRFAANRNPHLAWSAVPEATQSFALLCIDPDAPTRPDDVNKEDREVPADLPRADFLHWAMANIPPAIREITAGSCSDGVVPRGKQTPPGPPNTVQGVNDYTSWFSGDADMAGTYRGYDGPCPPWNDALVHRYVFTIYALDTAALALPADFNAEELRTATKGHVLAEASITATYTLNPRLR